MSSLDLYFFTLKALQERLKEMSRYDMEPYRRAGKVPTDLDLKQRLNLSGDAWITISIFSGATGIGFLVAFIICLHNSVNGMIYTRDWSSLVSTIICGLFALLSAKICWTSLLGLSQSKD